jgi:hypothetical protein
LISYASNLLGVGFFHTVLHKRPTISAGQVFSICEVVAGFGLVLLANIRAGAGVCGLIETVRFGFLSSGSIFVSATSCSQKMLLIGT